MKAASSRVPRTNKNLALFFLLLVLLTGCKWFHSPGITLMMENRTTANILNIEVEYPGGSFGLPRVLAGRSRSRWIKPTGSGPVNLRFADDSGKHRLTLSGVKPGDKGTIQIVFLGSGRTSVTQLTAP